MTDNQMQIRELKKSKRNEIYCAHELTAKFYKIFYISMEKLNDFSGCP